MKASLYFNYRRYRCIRCNKDETSNDKQRTEADNESGLEGMNWERREDHKPKNKDENVTQNMEGFPM